MNIQTNYFTVAQLGLNHHLFEPLACPWVLWMDGPVLLHKLGSLARPHAPSCISLITALEATWYNSE